MPLATTPGGAVRGGESARERIVERVPMTRLRARIAERLLKTQSTCAILTTFNEVDMRPVLQLCERLGERFRREHGVALHFMAFFVKAAAEMLRAFPILNASVDGDDIVYHRFADIGLGLNSPRGTATPVLRDVDGLSIVEIARRIHELSEGVRDGELPLDDFVGGTFSIADCSGTGALMSTQILNAPQSATLCIHSITDRVIVDNGQMAIRPMCYLTLTYDHRIITGQDAILGLAMLKDAMEHVHGHGAAALATDGIEVGAVAELPEWDSPLVVREADRAIRHRQQAAPSSPALQSRSDERPRAPAGDLSRQLSSILAGVLGLEMERIDPDAQFTDLGMDSTTAIEWLERVNQVLGTSVMPTMVYAHPNLRRFAEFISTRIPGTPPASASDSPRLERQSAPPRGGVERAVARKDAVAIIGMSARYPGAPTLDDYWENLKAGRNSVREVPRSRWNVDKLFDPKPFQQGKTSSKWLGVLDDVDSFDALFFGISPAGAESIDPQHRLFLQEAYKAIESAGYAPHSLRGTHCGVYLGLCNNDYSIVQRSAETQLADRLGNSGAIASARIAYYLDLKGPAITIDTACSSSLVALHTARQALLGGEIDLALAGGVSLYLTPEWYVCMSAAGVLSPDGQCKTFDRRANGFVPGEGVGAVVLKRLSDAERDGDNILGVLIGSGMNQDGKTNGITAPSMTRQTELFRRIYDKEGISARSINYVEAHGTGTKLGDPIELEALATAFGVDTDERGFCAIGSVKSNIGHTTAAAGLAGVHKVLLSLRSRQLPPTINFTEPNEHFDFERSPFFVNTQLRPWESIDGRPRRAAVSSFGISGTNSHVVLEEYAPPAERGQSAHPAGEPMLFVLSARSIEQLTACVAQFKRHVERHSEMDLRDAAFTLLVGRDAMDFRMAFIARSREELIAGLAAFLASPSSRAQLLAPGADAETADLRRLAEAWLDGDGVDWQARHPMAGARRAWLPTYPFAKESHWAPQAAHRVDADVEASAAADSHGEVGAAAPPAPTHFDELLFDKLFDDLIGDTLSLDAAVEKARTAIFS